MHAFDRNECSIVLCDGGSVSQLKRDVCEHRWAGAKVFEVSERVLIERIEVVSDKKVDAFIGTDT